MNGLFAATILSVASLAPVVACAVPLNVYEDASNDEAKQTHFFHDALATSIARTVTQLRAAHFSDGKAKPAQRIERDRQTADKVEQIAVHLTDKQAGDLVNMIAEYAAAQPNTELELK